MIFVGLVMGLAIAYTVYHVTTSFPYLDNWNTPHGQPNWYGRVAIVSKWLAIVLGLAIVAYATVVVAHRFNLP